MPNRNDMNISLEEFIRIEKYLDRTPEEEDFSGLKKRKELAWDEKVEQIRFLRNGIELIAMKSKIDHFHKKMRSSNSSIKRLFPTWSWISCLFPIANGDRNLVTQLVPS